MKLYLRECFINNCNVKLKSVECCGKKSYNKKWFNIFRLLPFNLIKLPFKLCKGKIIYQIDNIYFSNYGNIKISPIINNVSVYHSEPIESEKIDITATIKKYNHNIPFWYIIANENIDVYDMIQFKYFLKGKLENKVINIKDLDGKLLYDIFN